MPARRLNPERGWTQGGVPGRMLGPEGGGLEGPTSMEKGNEFQRGRWALKESGLIGWRGE